MRDVSKSLNYIAQTFSRKNICLCKTGEVKFEKKNILKKMFFFIVCIKSIRGIRSCILRILKLNEPFLGNVSSENMIPKFSTLFS